MIRVFLGLILGAGIMYFLDPRHGRDRRQMLTDRIGGGRLNFTERADEALQAGGDTYAEAKERAQATVRNVADRTRETSEEAIEEALEWADDTRERARSLANGDLQG